MESIAGLTFVTPNDLCVARVKSLFDKEPATISWIDAMPKESVLYDIGANIGIYSLYAASKGHDVIAVEPMPASFGALAESIALNGLADKVTPVCIALSDQRKVIRLGRNVAGTGIEDREGLWSVAMPLDDLTPIIGKVPTHIKIDTDGFDWPVLRGARKALRNAESVIVETELSSEARSQVIYLMTSAGFKLTGRHVCPFVPGSPVGMDHYHRKDSL